MAQQREHVGATEETFMRMLHVGGVNLGVFVMAGAAVLTFVLAFVRLTAAVAFVFGADPRFVLFAAFGIERVPMVLTLINVVDAAILAAIFLTFAFGLKSVFLGKRYKVLAFDIRDIDELKTYLIGLVVTLMATRFLEFILGTVRPPGTEVLMVGGGIGIVVAALTGYTFVLKQRNTCDEEAD